MQMEDCNERVLTQSLSFATAVRREEGGGRHDLGRATSVPGAGTKQSEVLGEFDSLI